jgi:hypothetical protein
MKYMKKKKETKMNEANETKKPDKKAFKDLIKRDEFKEFEKAQKLQNLSFIDGVVITWEVFNKILEKRLTDEDGDLETDKEGYDYLGIIEDDVTDLLLNKVLELGYFKFRGVQLCDKFGIYPGYY